MTTTEQTGRQIAERSLRTMVDGTRADFVEVIHPEAVNGEAAQEPPACRGRGPDAFRATAIWLRRAFGELAFTVHWANRDDLGTGAQLGWAPPSPRYLLRMALATRRARRAAGR